MKSRKALSSTGNAGRLQQRWLSDCSQTTHLPFSVCQLQRSKGLLLAATLIYAFLHDTFAFNFCQSSPVTPHIKLPYSSFTTLLPFCRMSRDQRSKDNWALLYACEVAQRSGANVVVAFNLVNPAELILASQTLISTSRLRQRASFLLQIATCAQCKLLCLESEQCA